MKYVVRKETEKALLLEVEGIEAWIPKAWVLENGELNDSARAKFRTEDTWVVIPESAIVEEREKAVKITANIRGTIAPSKAFTSSMLKDKVLKSWKIWLPKFAMKKDDTWKVKKSFLTDKLVEIVAEASYAECLYAEVSFSN